LDVLRHHEDIDISNADAEIPEQLAGDFKIAMQLACDAADHIRVTALLGHVEAGKQSMAEGYQVRQEALAFGLPQLVRSMGRSGPAISCARSCGGRWFWLCRRIAEAPRL